MNVIKRDGRTALELNDDEVELLCWALERASFIDTPAEKQPQIAAFASQALELLAQKK